MTHRNRFAAALALVLTVGTGGCLDQEAGPIMGPSYSVLADDSSLPRSFKVYTQNMFLGGETAPLFSIPLTDPAAIGDLIAATADFYYNQVLQSDIPGRAAAFVDEIDQRRPHVVALQEAVGYATGTLELPAFSFTPTGAGPDLLGSVMAEIAARGLPYSVAVERPTTAIALPVGPPDATTGLLPAIGVQDRVVLLVRDDIEEFTTRSGIYNAALPLGPAEIRRGWASLTVERDGDPYHFVATHLETQGSGPTDPIRQVHDGQAFELQNAVLAGMRGNLVLMGDLNSDAAADPSAPSWTPTYGNLVEGGFIDVWQTSPHAETDEGATCCLEPGRTLEERIDFVLFRTDAQEDPDSGAHRGFYQTEIVGDEAADQTATGQWPSDHAGILASIEQPGTAR